MHEGVHEGVAAYHPAERAGGDGEDGLGGEGDGGPEGARAAGAAPATQRAVGVAGQVAEG